MTVRKIYEVEVMVVITQVATKQLIIALALSKNPKHFVEVIVMLFVFV